MGPTRVVMVALCLASVCAARANEPSSDTDWHQRIELEQPPVIRAVEGSPPPPGYERATRIDGRQFARGIAVFAPGYVITSVIGVAKGGGALGLVPCWGAWAPDKNGNQELDPLAGLLALFGCAYQLLGSIEMGIAVSEATPVYVRQAPPLSPNTSQKDSSVLLEYSLTF